MKNQLLIKIHQQPQTVFTLTDLVLLSPQQSYDNLKNQVAYLVKKQALLKLRKGLYAKENYNPLELANKLYTPSYISLETVLAGAGIIFQHYSQIFSVSYLTRNTEVGKTKLEYRSLKKTALLNHQGIEKQGVVNIATPERAFLDTIYLRGDYYFDHLDGLNWELVFALQNLYQNKTLVKRVAGYYQAVQDSNA